MDQVKQLLNARHEYLHGLWGTISTGEVGILLRKKEAETQAVPVERLTADADRMETLIEASAPLAVRLDLINREV
jgi:hypothetical protein